MVNDDRLQCNVKPFLKWAGGKGKLVPLFEEQYPLELVNNQIKTYVEPFIGGGSVFLNNVSKYNFDNIIINDINKELILTYKVVKAFPVELMEKLDMYQKHYNNLQSLELKEEYYYSIRENFNEGKGNVNYDNIEDIEVEHAAYMIFLNKSCFNGLYRENKKGKFNVPFGKKEKVNCYDENNILDISKILKKAIILNGDFEEVEKYINDNTFVYMDPPYRPLNGKNSFVDYSKEDFNDDTQKRLSDFYRRITQKGAKVMESNSDPKNVDESDDFFDELYKEFRIERIKAARNINSKGTGRGKVSEILVMNY